MAVKRFAKPGDKGGPCEKLCTHEECLGVRMASRSLCRFCRQMIGYDREFYPGTGGFAHAECLESTLKSEDLKWRDRLNSDDIEIAIPWLRARARHKPSNDGEAEACERAADYLGNMLFRRKGVTPSKPIQIVWGGELPGTCEIANCEGVGMHLLKFECDDAIKVIRMCLGHSLHVAVLLGYDPDQLDR